jgi:ATP phosphoribosyltransferase
MKNGLIRLALPSKGQLGEATLLFLKACGLAVNKTNPRQYTATLPALPEVEVVFQRSADIPRTVSYGDVDLGITGIDTLQEHALEADSQVLVLHDRLGYGGCSLVVAVPEAWPLENTADLAAYARQKNGLRVATSFPNLTGKFLSERGVGPLKVILASGALEAMPTIGSADFICDITATGTTLRDNHLKPLSDGSILYSEASLITNPDNLRQTPPVQAVARRLLELFEANLRATGKYLIFCNMRGESPESIAERLFQQTSITGLTGPTIAPIYSQQSSSAGRWYSVSVVVGAKDLYAAIGELRAIGGSGVVVTPTVYIFDEYPESCQALDTFIKQKGA